MSSHTLSFNMQGFLKGEFYYQPTSYAVLRSFLLLCEENHLLWNDDTPISMDNAQEHNSFSASTCYCCVDGLHVIRARPADALDDDHLTTTDDLEVFDMSLFQQFMAGELRVAIVSESDAQELTEFCQNENVIWTSGRRIAAGDEYTINIFLHSGGGRIYVYIEPDLGTLLWGNESCHLNSPDTIPWHEFSASLSPSYPEGVVPSSLLAFLFPDTGTTESCKDTDS